MIRVAYEETCRAILDVILFQTEKKLGRAMSTALMQPFFNAWIHTKEVFYRTKDPTNYVVHFTSMEQEIRGIICILKACIKISTSRGKTPKFKDIMKKYLFYFQEFLLCFFLLLCFYQCPHNHHQHQRRRPSVPLVPNAAPSRNLGKGVVARAAVPGSEAAGARVTRGFSTRGTKAYGRVEHGHGLGQPWASRKLPLKKETLYLLMVMMR